MVTNGTLGESISDENQRRDVRLGQILFRRTATGTGYAASPRFGDWKWRWLHYSGQSGIGKTTLLRRFAAEWKNRELYYVDASRGIQNKEDVLDCLAEQLRQAGETGLQDADSDEIVRRMNRRAQLSGNCIVLLIDAFDRWRSLENWFLAWLDSREPSIRIVTAGRNALTGGWLRSGWAGLLHTIELQALNPVEVERYAQERGIATRDEQLQLFRFSRGCPACDGLSRGDDDRERKPPTVRPGGAVSADFRIDARITARAPGTGTSIARSRSRVLAI